MDFTLRAYERLLRALLGSYPDGNYTVRAAVATPGERRCILRHDVDRWPFNARRMACLESAYGVCASYYFRARDLGKASARILGIAHDGHEVGYHHEALSRANGDIVRAGALFSQDIATLRALIPDISTAAMHGAPLSQFDNLRFWNHHTPAEFGLQAEAFHVVADSSWTYVTDTGRSWSPKSANLRDRARAARTLPAVQSTQQLVDTLDGLEGCLCLVVHPERWNPLGMRYARAWARDCANNLAKGALVALQGRDDGVSGNAS